ncbi:guanine nucleotide-binding protein G(I)/G(S)/G(O) subunit gamma-7-like [Ciona intestinalis]
MSEVEEDPFMLMNADELKIYIAQLQRESANSRIKTSEGSKDLMSFIQENTANDPLLTGIDSKTNPFIEKKDCIIF